MLSKQSPFRQVTGKQASRRFRWAGDYLESRIMEGRSPHGVGGPVKKIPLIPPLKPPDSISLPFMGLWGEARGSDSDSGGRSGGRGANDSARMQLLCALT